jgi:1-pyrroline-5-carboxylate dehydrogenase
MSFKAAEELAKPEVVHFFAKLIMRTSPKSYAQAMGEVKISRTFLENYSGD